MNKILIIDNEELTRNTFSEVLRSYHFSTLEACDGRSGIGIFEKEIPDAVLLELIMPGMDGMETMQEMRKIDPDVPIIFATAHGDIPTAVEAVKMGADDFIVKPPDYKMLVHAIERAVEQLRLKRECAAVRAQILEAKAANRQLKREIAERLRMEERLAESESRYRELVENSGTGIIIIDQDGIFKFANRQAAEKLGKESKDIIGKSLFDFLPANTARKYLETNRALMASGGRREYEDTFLLPGGERTFLIVDQCLKDAAGNVVGMQSSSIDISARKRTEEERRNSEKRLRLQFNSMPVGCTLLDPDLVILDWNPAAERIFGFKKEEVVGKNPFGFIVRDSVRPFVETFLKDLKQGNHTIIGVNENMTKDGSSITCQWHDTPVRDESGDLIGIVAMAEDITERRLAEKALKESENTYRTIFENTGAATVLFEEDGIISHANNKFVALSGYSKEEIEGRKNWREFVAERDIERMNSYNRLRNIDPQAAPKSYEFHFINRLDRIKDIALDADVVPGTKKVVASLLDITERKLAEAALERYALEMKNLSSRLADIQETERRQVARELHDEIGQALTGLNLALETLEGLPERQIRNELKKTHILVGELMSRVRDMSLSLRPSMLDDLGLLPTLLWHFRRYTAQTNIHITFKHACLDCRFEPEVETAAYRVVQEALTNIARHASADRAEVLVMVNNDTLEIYIRDRGKGFDPGTASATGDSAGLSGMRERAELLGGQMTIESAPGAGTSLSVRMPLRKQSLEKPSEDA